MALQLGDTAPDFEADTTEGRDQVPRLARGLVGRAVLASAQLHARSARPSSATWPASSPSSTSAASRSSASPSIPSSNHEQWSKDIEETQGTAPNYPLIGDSDFNVSKLYGMLPADVSGDPTSRTPADNQTVRNVFVIGPDKKVKLILVYPMTTGRNFDEVLRVIDSLQLTAKHKVATPVNWQQGEDVIIAGSVSDEAAKERTRTAGSRRSRTSGSCPTPAASRHRMSARRVRPASPRGARGGEPQDPAACEMRLMGGALRDPWGRCVLYQRR